MPLRLFKTERFSVLGFRDEISKFTLIPVISLLELITCSYQPNSMQELVMKAKLWNALETYGFLILSYSQHSEPGRIIYDFKHSIETDFFPDSDIKVTHQTKEPASVDNAPSTHAQYKRPRNVAQLQSGFVYSNERNVPMYKLGYELCDDIREVYRVHAGSPDSQPWPTRHEKTKTATTSYSSLNDPRNIWLRAMALCRHICDEALHLCLGYDMKIRPGSGAYSWRTPKTNNRPIPYYEKGSLEDRYGDKSIMYAMHYFNDHESILARTSGSVTGTNEITINVKEHTDPSLFVLEPFLADVEGLQVHPRTCNIFGDVQSSTSLVNEYGWIACDGITSPIRQLIKEDKGECAMILFVGRAFAEKAFEYEGRTIIPTLHRVVGPSIASKESRRTVIFEQKYEEYFPPVTMD